MADPTSPTEPARAPLLEGRRLVKRYGNVVAADAVDLQLFGGEVHGLLGENGAGKSTVSKILYGFVRPDSGEVIASGQPVTLRSPRDARRLGIGMVFQNFMLVPAFTVLENIALFLTDLPVVLNREELVRRIAALSNRYGLGVDPHAPVHQLSVGDQQKVEILKLLLAHARVLILDEPTKVLAAHEVEALFRVFASLKAEGYAILFITHKIREVLACADRISVLRHGARVGGFGAGEADAERLVATMFGERHDSPAAAAAATDAAVSGPAVPVIELRGATVPAAGHETALRDIDVSVARGEIVGVAGVSGSGQKELGDAMLGLRRLAAGEKRFDGHRATSWSVARLRQQGVAVIPEDPARMAAFPGLSVRENLALGTGARYRRGPRINWSALTGVMQRSFAALGFPVPPLQMPMKALSGGNLQRVVIAREMAHEPVLVVALYPTRGLDVLSARSLRAVLLRVRAAGHAVLLISEDLEELAELSDRLLVLFAGQVAGEFRRGEWRPEQVGRLMTGSREAAHA